MIYSIFKSLLLKLVKAPDGPPEPPAGSPDSVEVFRASRRLITVRLLVLGIAAAFTLLPTLLAFAGAISADAPPTITFALAMLVSIEVAAFLLQYFVIRLDYDMRYYIVTDRSLRIRHGALLIVESTFTFANIQNLSIRQGPLERLLGIANLQIQTAGGGAQPAGNEGAGAFHSGRLAGIENAEQLRDRILAKLKAYRDAGLGDADDSRGASHGLALGVEASVRLREIRDELRALRGIVSG